MFFFLSIFLQHGSKKQSHLVTHLAATPEYYWAFLRTGPCKWFSPVSFERVFLNDDEHNTTWYTTWPTSAKRLGLQREPFWVFHDASTAIRIQRQNRTPQDEEQDERYEKGIRCQAVCFFGSSLLHLIDFDCLCVLSWGLHMKIEQGMHPMMWMMLTDVFCNSWVELLLKPTAINSPSSWWPNITNVDLKWANLRPFRIPWSPKHHETSWENHETSWGLVSVELCPTPDFALPPGLQLSEHWLVPLLPVNVATPWAVRLHLR